MFRFKTLMFLILVASMILSACGGQATTPPTAATEAPAATEPPAATEAPATEAAAATEAPAESVSAIWQGHDLDVESRP